MNKQLNRKLVPSKGASMLLTDTCIESIKWLQINTAVCNSGLNYVAF